MVESKKEVFRITNKGIILVDDIPTNFEYLYNKIKSKSCIIIMYNEADYINLLVPFETWLSDKVSEDDFKETVAYVKNQWQKNLEIMNNIKNREAIILIRA